MGSESARRQRIAAKLLVIRASWLIGPCATVLALGGCGVIFGQEDPLPLGDMTISTDPAVVIEYIGDILPSTYEVVGDLQNRTDQPYEGVVLTFKVFDADGDVEYSQVENYQRFGICRGYVETIGVGETVPFHAQCQVMTYGGSDYDRQTKEAEVVALTRNSAKAYLRRIAAPPISVFGSPTTLLCDPSTMVCEV